MLGICNYCHEDFKVLGRHSWRCKAKVQQGRAITEDNQQPAEILPNNDPVVSSTITCCCGKKCKGNRGLKIHQRSCRTIKGLQGITTNDLNHEETASNEAEGDEVDIDSLLGDTADNPILKKGVKLPKSDQQWSNANNFFKSVLFIDEIKESTLNHCCQKMSQTMYDYFAERFGCIENNRTVDLEFKEKYNGINKNLLKKALKKLKSDSSAVIHENTIREIKYVSKLLRSKVDHGMTSDNPRIDTADHYSLIKKSFWKYAKEFIEKPREKLPSFNMHRCFSYFYKIFKALCPNRIFLIPDWIPRLATPTIQFNTSPPTYSEITSIIRKMKTSGSPCPLDQISIIALKRSPFLRTYLTEIISQAWRMRTIPDTWKKRSPF